MPMPHGFTLSTDRTYLGSYYFIIQGSEFSTDESSLPYSTMNAMSASRARLPALRSARQRDHVQALTITRQMQFLRCDSNDIYRERSSKELRAERQPHCSHLAPVVPHAGNASSL